MTEPIAVNPWMLGLWRTHHDDTPLLILRCARTDCHRVLGKVWRTPKGLLIWTLTHVTDNSITVTGDGAAVIETGLAPFERWDSASETARALRLPDATGTIALLDRDDYWFGAEAGCGEHEGVTEIDRDAIIDLAIVAVRSGQTGMRVPIPLG